MWPASIQSLQVSWNRRFSKGLLFGAAYTLSKSSDSGSRNATSSRIPTTPATCGGLPTSTPAISLLLTSSTTAVPQNQNNLAGKIIGGWQLSGIFQAQTGTPCGIAKTNDYAGVGQDGNWDGCPGGQFWVVNGPIKTPHQQAYAGNPGYWFDPSVFSAPAKGTFNMQSVRGTIYYPGFNNWNLGLFKKFAVTERVGFQFRAEAFNAFNHPNWNAPGTDPTN